MTEKIEKFIQYLGFEKLTNYNGTCPKCDSAIHEDFLIAIPPPINMEDGSRRHFLWFPIECEVCGNWMTSITAIAYNVSEEFNWLNRNTV